MSSFLGQNTPYPFLAIPTPKPKPCRSSSLHFITHAGPPARDRVIDFGKYKGRMLGTLPSTYLKWVSHNLRARDFEEWANLADQVLQDPVYNDRIEWEFAEKLLHGNNNIKSEGAVSKLLEISQRFGWDNDDKVGWSKVDFQLLGSSRSGRIPRAKEKKEEKKVEMKKVDDGGGDGRRGVRRERVKMKRRMRKNVDDVSFLQKAMPSPVGPHTLARRNDEELVKVTQLNNKHGASFMEKAVPSPIGPHTLARRNGEELVEVTQQNNKHGASSMQKELHSPTGPHTLGRLNDEELVKLTRLNNKHGASLEFRNVVESEGLGSKSDENEKVYNPFPGRESLVRKVLSRRSDL